MVVSSTHQLEKGRNKMAENILNLTLEIIHLLTGEDCIVVKKTSGECVTSTEPPDEQEVWSRTQRLLMESLIDERSNEQKILDLTNKIIELLTGEVPIRCDDVTVHFSMEEWEYLEDHKDLYKDVIMEDHQTMTSPGESLKKSIPARCPSPLHSWNFSEEHHDVSLDHQSEDLIDIKGEVARENERDFRGSQQFKEEDMYEDVSPADDGTELSEGHHFFPEYEADLKDFPHHTFMENAIPTDITSVLRDLSSDPTNHREPSPDPSQMTQQDSGYTDGKIYSRSEFGRRYKTGPNFSMRVRIHRNQRFFSCLECGKSFTRKWSLVEHHRRHTGERPFSCLECGKCFSRKSVLVEHQKSHTGEKPYACSQCPRSFIAKQHLERHQITHTGERPFPCTECGRSFNRKWLLERHLRTHVK